MPASRSSVPKSRFAGTTTRWVGVRPTPKTVLVLLPPLLTKITTLLKLPALVGLKLTCTEPVWLEGMLKGLPLWMANGRVVETEPVSAWPPVLVNWKLRVLLCPTMTEPKARLDGPRAKCGGGLVTAM